MSEMNDALDHEVLLGKVKAALNLARIKLPYLSGFFAIMKVQLDKRCPTACVFASGRTLVHPKFADSLTTNELIFILAHEALHLLLRTHERRHAGDKSGYLENIAHDFIINNRLVQELYPGISNSKDNPEYCLPPKGGLWWPNYREDFEKHCERRTWKPASEYSLEELVACLMCIQRDFRTWSLSHLKKKKKKRNDSEDIIQGGLGNSTSGGFGDQIADLLNLKEFSETNKENEENEKKQLKELLCPNNQDVLSEELEEQLFPGDSTNGSLPEEVFLELAKRATAERNFLDQIAQLQSLQQSLQGGNTSGSYSDHYDALRGFYRPPWEAALQRWFDNAEPGDRSWARPSRRGAFRTDVVLPGRKRESWTLNIVLDTSGSMSYALSRALGVIADYCENAGIQTVRIIQIDTIIQADELVEVADLSHYKILGLGGNDMQPAWDLLTADPMVERVVVISDGYFDVPPEPPFEVLWTLTQENEWFRRQATYGTVVCIESETR